MFSRCKNQVIVLTVFFVFGFVFVGTVSAVTWFVDDDGIANFSVIQDAVDAANPGDTVVVRDGIYSENVVVNKSLIIKSVNGAGKTIVQTANSDDPVFEVTADHVEISGFTTKNTIEEYGGIHLLNANYCNISSNKILGKQLTGFYTVISRGIYLTDSSNNNIVKNKLVRHLRGIFLDSSSHNNIIENEILNNEYGIRLEKSNSNKITGNKISIDYFGVFLPDGIYLKHSANNNITENDLSNNYLGIVIWDHSDNNRVYLNNFVENKWNNTYSDSDSTNIWNSPESIAYTYNDNTYTNYLGNYWDDYSDIDADGNGIWDNPYTIDGDEDNYSLTERFENYKIEVLTIDFKSEINFGIIVPGVHKWLQGDDDMSTPSAPTVKNEGDVPILIGLKASPMVGLVHGKTIIDFDAQFRGEQLFFSTNEKVWFSKPLEPYHTRQIDFSVEAIVGRPADTYEGILTLSDSLGMYAIEIPITAMISGGGCPPVVEYLWVLPDEDNITEGTQIGSYSGINRTDIYGCLVVSDPNGRDDISDVWVDVYHPNGSFKYQAHAVKLDIVSQQAEIEACNDAALAAGLITQADHDQIDYNISDHMWYMYEVDMYCHHHQPTGDYEVKAFATDGQSGVSECKTSTFEYLSLNQPPIANFIFSPQNPVVNQIITFNASNSTDLDGFIIDYGWYFGDGMNESEMVVNHSYSASGMYTVTLTVTDDEGATNTISRQITVGGYPSELQVGDIVLTTVYLHVRNISNWSNPLDLNNLVFTMHPPDGGVNPPYDVGKIVEDPETDSQYGYTWWGVEWDNGEVGWSAEGSLEELTERWLIKTDKAFVKIQDLEDPFNYQGEYELNQSELRAEEKKEEVLQNVTTYAEKYKVSPALVMALIRQESDFDANAEGDYWAGEYHSFGYMQVSYGAATDTYKEYTGDEYKGTEEEWRNEGLNPEINIRYGVRYLRIQHDRIKDACIGYEDVYGDILKSTISAYNAGHPVFKTSNKDVRACYVLGARCKYESGYEGPNPGGSYAGVIEGKPIEGKHRGYKFFLANRGTPNQPPICSLSATQTSGNAPLTVIFSMNAIDTDGSIASWSLDINNNGTPEYSGSGNPSTTQQHIYQTSGAYTANLTVTDEYGAKDYCEKLIEVYGIGYAVIIAGEDNIFVIGGVMKHIFDRNANKAYNVLHNRGFDDEHILYLNDKGYQGVDKALSVENFRDTMENWIPQRVGKYDPLILYISAHGTSRCTIALNDTTVVSCNELKKWLDKLPEGTKMLIVIDACYSGKFITNEDNISFQNRAIITSTKPNQDIRPWADQFSRVFWESIEGGDNVKQAFIKGSEDHIVDWFKYHSYIPGIEFSQPWLDDNGDSVGHSSEFLDDDGEFSSTMKVGVPWGPPPSSCPGLPLNTGTFCSPGEFRVYDSQERVTGLVDGMVMEEIPNSLYDQDIKTVVIFNSTDVYRYEVVGSDTGTYGLIITSIEDDEATTFTAVDIPTSPSAVHQYTINWDVLSQGGEGVTVQIDSDGDGVFEQVITTDNSFHPPIASFVYSPENPVVGEEVTFNASNSTDPDGFIVNYDWGFGDGNTVNSTGEVVIYSYSSAGEYNVTLVVTDDEGVTDSDARIVSISETPPTTSTTTSTSIPATTSTTSTVSTTSTTSTTCQTTTTTVPDVPPIQEFPVEAIPLTILLVVPVFAYLIIWKRE